MQSTIKKVVKVDSIQLRPVQAQISYLLTSITLGAVTASDSIILLSIFHVGFFFRELFAWANFTPQPMQH
jgi:hypothetical protein